MEYSKQFYRSGVKCKITDITPPYSKRVGLHVHRGGAAHLNEHGALGMNLGRMGNNYFQQVVLKAPVRKYQYSVFGEKLYLKYPFDHYYL